MAYRFKHGDRPVEGYTIQRAIGAGGFGEVYYAVSDGGREVALKYLRDNPEIELRGVSACMNLKSPHLVSIFDVRKSVDNEYFILMEYCSGPSLRDLLVAEPNGLGEQKAAFFVREIAKGLAYLHDRGVVHRDLKPGNIFYDDGYVKIGDYGLSKFMSVSRHSGQTASVGTVHYMAPEIGSGDYGRGVDIYALGVMLYEMLLGRVPFEGSSMGEVLMKHLTSQPEVDNLPDPFARVIRRALQKDPRERYQTVDEMVTELLDVEHVQQSLAGFSAKSLEGAVRRGGPAGGTPMPSPNPRAFANEFQPGPRLRNDAAPGAPLPDRLQRRVDRISRKVDDRVAKLGGQRHGGPPPLPPASGKATPPTARPDPAPVDRRKRLVVAGVCTIVTSIGAAAVGATMFSDEAAIGAGLAVAATTAGLIAARGAIDWLGHSGQAPWVQRFMTVVLAGPALTLGLLPTLTSRNEEEGVAVLMGLAATLVLFNWRAAFTKGADGRLPIWRAVWVGWCAAMLTAAGAAMVNAEPPEAMLCGAVIAAALAINVHLLGWSLPLTGGWGLAAFGISGRFHPPVASAEGQPERRGEGSSVVGGGPYLREGWTGADSAAGTAGPPHVEQPRMAVVQPVQPNPLPPFAHPVSVTPRSHRPSTPPGGRVERSTAARVVWAVASFLCFGVFVIALVVNIVERMPRSDERIAALAVCIGGAAAAFFCVTKTTRLKRRTVWRETLWPLGVSLGAASTAMCIAMLALPMGTMSRPVVPALLVLLGIGGVSLLLMLIAAVFMFTDSAREFEQSAQSFIREPQGSGVHSQPPAAVNDEHPVSPS